MSDYIDREQAIDVVLNTEPLIIEIGGVSYVGQKTGDVVSALQALPPAQQWIPCSERLPEDEEEVLVTRHFLSDKQLKKNGITESVYVEVASHMGDEWTSYSDEYKIKMHLHKVIAWMPLPEPFREDGDTNDVS